MRILVFVKHINFLSPFYYPHYILEPLFFNRIKIPRTEKKNLVFEIIIFRTMIVC